MYSSYNEMVDINAVFIRKAKRTKDTYLPGSFNGEFQFQYSSKPSRVAMKQNYCGQQEIICSCEFSVKIGGIITNNNLRM